MLLVSAPRRVTGPKAYSAEEGFDVVERKLVLALMAIGGIVVALAPAVVHSEVVRRIDASGTLTGASNVMVDGRAFDVNFVDGSCIGVFRNCSPSQFEFRSPDEASVATRALLDQVLSDGPSGLFDSRPSLTLGCADPDYCVILTPYDVERDAAFVVGAGNDPLMYDGNGVDGVVCGGPAYCTVQFAYDTALDGRLVLAVWSPARAVPAPDTLALVAMAALALALRRRMPVGSCARGAV